VKRIYEAQFTVPAGTVIAAPVSQPVVLEDANLDTVRVIVPDGHSGLTGLRITWGGVQILPINPGTWVVSNNEIFDWPADEEVTANGLSLTGYNLDVYPHAFYLRFQISDRAGSPVAGIQSGQTDLAATAASTLDVSQLAAVNVPVASAAADSTAASAQPDVLAADQAGPAAP
jgi:hypothetical protein